MANTNGGTIYIGVKADAKTPTVGVEQPEEAIATLKAEIQRKITPALKVEITAMSTLGRPVLQVSVPMGADVPYALEGTSIYLRQESETHAAMRDEIMALIRRTLKTEPETPPEVEPVAGEAAPIAGVEPPGTGVQIVASEERKGIWYHTMKDLRNGNVVHDVTRSSARKLWRYAIADHETNPVDAESVKWQGDLGVWKSSKRAGKVRYDLVQRMPDGQMQVYYGVTEDGIAGDWRVFLTE